MFQFTRPVGGATGNGSIKIAENISFNSRAPWGARRRATCAGSARIRRFNSRAPWGARPSPQIVHSPPQVSIHAPRGGRDAFAGVAGSGLTSFNSRAPWGARPGPPRVTDSATGFNSRAPWGARPADPAGAQPQTKGFNSRAPWGARPSAAGFPDRESLFQFTRPVGGATGPPASMTAEELVSIHAPRGGRDRRRRARRTSGSCFNSRAPWGARHPVHGRAGDGGAFQFTRPVGGATEARFAPFEIEIVSIHAPRGGRDAAWDATVDVDPLVSIHAPRGGRDPEGWKMGQLEPFQFTRPVGGATATTTNRSTVGNCFNSRAPWGARPATPRSRRGSSSFNSRAPWGARPTRSCRTKPSTKFQFTRPVGGATSAALRCLMDLEFQFTRPVGGATARLVR